MSALLDKIIDSEEYFYNLKTKKIVCWGAGSKGRQTLELLREKGIEPIAFCDNNKDLQGKSMKGIPILNYDTIKNECSDYCICITCTYFNAMGIYNELKNSGGVLSDIYFISNPFKAEDKFLSTTEIREKIEEYEESYDALEDERSKEIFLSFLNWKITGDMRYTAENTEGNWLEFFDENIIPDRKDYCFIDVGGYTGDTICRFLAFVKGNYDRIIVFEPDDNNFAALKSLTENGRLERIEFYKSGLWSEECEKIFYTGESGIYESSNFFRGVSVTLSNKLLNDMSGREQKIKVSTLDKMIQYDKISSRILLKIDALASEGPILLGAKKLIKETKPTIIMEYGTHSEYIGNVIPFLRSINGEYKFYLRQRNTFGNSRTILYAV